MPLPPRRTPRPWRRRLAPVPRAPPRVRSHCRFVLALILLIQDLLGGSTPLF
jgi:hypothetical protein